MKGILKFNLPEETDDFKLAQLGSKMFCILWELVYKEIKNKLKHGHSFKSADEALKYIRDFINDRINLDEVE